MHPPSAAIPISLAPLARAHTEALARQLADPRVYGTFSRIAASSDGAARAIEGELTGAWQRVRAPFAICLGETLVGLCGLSRRNRPVWEREVYFWVGFAHWGRGVATRAVGLLLASDLLDESVTRLTGLVLARNPASRRVLERNGFRLEGRFTAGAARLPEFAGEPVWELARAPDAGR